MISLCLMPMLMLKYGQNSGTEQEMRRAAAIRNGMSWNLGSRWRCRKGRKLNFTGPQQTEISTHGSEIEAVYGKLNQLSGITFCALQQRHQPPHQLRNLRHPEVFPTGFQFHCLDEPAANEIYIPIQCHQSHKVFMGLTPALIPPTWLPRLPDLDLHVPRFGACG